MAAFIFTRVMQSTFLLWITSVISFVAVYFIGNPVDILFGEMTTEAQRLEAIQALGLDRPLYEQYWVFVANLLHFDFGRSFVTSIPAGQLLLQSLPATVELTIAAFGISLLGVPLGVIAGQRPNSLLGKSIMSGSILGISLPSFWVGLVLIMVFSVYLGWLPATGRGQTVEVFGISWAIFTVDGWAHLVLPAVNLALFNMVLMVRLARSAMSEALLADYIRFARAKGLRRRRVVWVYAFRNILIPLVTIQGMELAHLLTGAIVTETIFGYPGVGRLAIQSLNLLDRPVIVAYMLLVVSIFIVINLIVDLLYAVIDPRVRFSEARND